MPSTRRTLLSRRPGPALVVSIVALVVATSGTGYAALRLPAHSVGTTQLRTGAVHSAEIEYAMGNLALNKVFAWTDDDRKVSHTMQGYFENFIKTGNPNGPGLPNWPMGAPDASGNVQRIRIDVETKAEPEPRARYLFQD